MLWNCLINELFKLKRSGVLWLATLGSILTNFMFVGTAMALTVVKTDLIADDPLASWENWIAFHYNGILPMLLPMYLVILCALSVNQEKRLRTWSTLAVLPVRPQFVYLAKLFIITLVFTFSHLIFAVLLVALPYVFQLSLANGSVQSGIIFQLFGSTILGSFGTIALVYLISYLSRNFVLPLAVGILGFVLSQLLHDNAIDAWFFPFSLPVEGMDDIMTVHGFPIGIIAISLVYFIVLTVAGTLMAGKFYPRA